MPNPRPFADVRALLLERAQQRRNPFLPNMDFTAVVSALERLESVEPQAWVDAFAALAAPHQAAAAVAERAGDATTAARERVWMPFSGGADEGLFAIGDLRKPHQARLPTRW